MEVVLSRLPKPIKIGPKFDDVQVQLHDLGLREATLQNLGQEKLVNLSQQRLVPSKPKILGELHSDGGTSALKLTQLDVIEKAIL